MCQERGSVVVVVSLTRYSKEFAHPAKLQSFHASVNEMRESRAHSSMRECSNPASRMILEIFKAHPKSFKLEENNSSFYVS